MLMHIQLLAYLVLISDFTQFVHYFSHFKRRVDKQISYESRKV